MRNNLDIITLETFLNARSSSFIPKPENEMDERLMKIREEWENCILLIEQMFLESILTQDWTELERFIESCKHEGEE